MPGGRARTPGASYERTRSEQDSQEDREARLDRQRLLTNHLTPRQRQLVYNKLCKIALACGTQGFNTFKTNHYNNEFCVDKFCKRMIAMDEANLLLFNIQLCLVVSSTISAIFS